MNSEFFFSEFLSPHIFLFPFNNSNNVITITIIIHSKQFFSAYTREVTRYAGPGIEGVGSGIRGVGSGIRGVGSGIRGVGSGIIASGSGITSHGIRISILFCFVLLFLFVCLFVCLFFWDFAHTLTT